jgi:hypothetical protein
MVFNVGFLGILNSSKVTTTILIFTKLGFIRKFRPKRFHRIGSSAKSSADLFADDVVGGGVDVKTGFSQTEVADLFADNYGGGVNVKTEFSQTEVADLFADDDVGSGVDVKSEFSQTEVADSPPISPTI